MPVILNTRTQSLGAKNAVNSSFIGGRPDDISLLWHYVIVQLGQFQNLLGLAATPYLPPQDARQYRLISNLCSRRSMTHSDDSVMHFVIAWVISFHVLSELKAPFQTQPKGKRPFCVMFCHMWDWIRVRCGIPISLCHMKSFNSQRNCLAFLTGAWSEIH